MPDVGKIARFHAKMKHRDNVIIRVCDSRNITVEIGHGMYARVFDALDEMRRDALHVRIMIGSIHHMGRHMPDKMAVFAAWLQ